MVPSHPQAPPGSGRPTVVLVAYYAPPAVGVAANRARATALGLAERGWRVVLVAPAEVHAHLGAPEELPGVEILRASAPEPSRWLRRLWPQSSASDAASRPQVRSLEPVGRGRIADTLRRWVREVLYIPDAHFPWIRPAARVIGSVLDASPDPVVVLSTSVPFSAHRAVQHALRTRSRAAVWVAEYRDPWTADVRTHSRRTALRRWIDTRVDRSIVSGADHLMVTSTTTRDLLVDHFDLSGVDVPTVVRNGWDARGDARPEPGAPFELTFAGTLLQARWAHPVLDALARLDEEGERVGLRVFGSADPWRAAATECLGGVPEWLRLEGMIRAEELPDRLSSSPALLLLRPGESGRYIISGKTYDYAAARRPVVAWAEEGTEMFGLLREHTDLHPVRGGSAEEFVAILRRLRDRRGVEVEPGEDRGLALSRAAQLDRLDTVLREFLEGCR